MTVFVIVHPGWCFFAVMSFALPVVVPVFQGEGLREAISIAWRVWLLQLFAAVIATIVCVLESLS